MNQHKHLEVSSPGSCCWRQQPLGHSSCSPGRGTAQHREEGQGCWACPAPAPAVLCRATSIQTRSLCPGTTCRGRFRGSGLRHRGQEGSRQSFFTTFGTWVQLKGPKPKPSICFRVYAVMSYTARGRTANPPLLERALGMGKRKARFSAALRTASKPCCYLRSRYGSTAGIAAECSDVPTLVTVPDCIAWSKDSHC